MIWFGNLVREKVNAKHLLDTLYISCLFWMRFIDRGNNKSLRWAAVEDLRIHRIHIFVTQEEVNKSSKYKIVYSSLSLNNCSSCVDGHLRLTFCHFPWAVNNELLFSFSTRRKFIQPKFTEDLQHSMVLKPTVIEVSNNGVNSSIAGAKTYMMIRGLGDPRLIISTPIWLHTWRGNPCLQCICWPRPWTYRP
jgi:hypothetical protein